jgi:hypothetical protein
MAKLRTRGKKKIESVSTTAMARLLRYGIHLDGLSNASGRKGYDMLIGHQGVSGAWMGIISHNSPDHPGQQVVDCKLEGTADEVLTGLGQFVKTLAPIAPPVPVEPEKSRIVLLR